MLMLFEIVGGIVVLGFMVLGAYHYFIKPGQQKPTNGDDTNAGA